jgi:GNAT superfamily N-acetyltransferase
MSNERDGAIHIRPAAEADQALLAELAARLTAFDVPPWRRPADIATADAREMMDAVRAGSPDNEVLIAERSGVPVGCLHILASTDFFGARHAHISVIATTEAAEGSGVGQALLRHAEGWARHRDYPLLTLNVFAANSRARRFYERAGWSAEMMKYVKPLQASDGDVEKRPGAPTYT